MQERACLFVLYKLAALSMQNAFIRHLYVSNPDYMG